MLNTRIEFAFTEADVERFRSSLSHGGFSVREVERVVQDRAGGLAG